MIKWSENFSVGVSAIDTQHQKLLLIIEEVFQSLKDNRFNFADTVELVTNLDMYLSKHFTFEENLMKNIEYSHRLEHVKEHNHFRSKMKELNIFDVNPNERFYKDMLVYLVDWLSRHIMETDKRLGRFILENKIQIGG